MAAHPPPRPALPAGAEPLPAGGVTTPAGFQAGAAACGLKASGAPDVALLVSEVDAAAAGVFTRNLVVAAPVRLDRATLASDAHRIRAVVGNAGNANACTGEAGWRAACTMQADAAAATGCLPSQVLVLSTGVIGAPLDAAQVARGIAAAAGSLSPDGGPAVARALMTTDTRPKEAAFRLALPGGGEVVLGGMAKGAGMIHPDMATLLSLLTTDAVVPPDQLQTLLASAVEETFNRITVDGDTSTNDTVLLLANGRSGQQLGTPARVAAFAAALQALCLELALQVVSDGEGAGRVARITVRGARREADALQVARAIATSPLFKTALAGGDPNWGRILAAAGRAGVDFAPERLRLDLTPDAAAPLTLVEHGEPVRTGNERLAALFAAPFVPLMLDLGAGTATATVWTCDFTHDYVRINADYGT